MALVLRDSTDATAIPLQGLAAVAGYGDGLYAWAGNWWSLFPPPIVRLVIVVDPRNAGDILDVETFDARPQDVPGWIDRFNRPGRRRPTVYCNRSTIDAVRQAAAGRAFDWWAATLDGTQDVPGAVAVQYAGSALTGGNYDESIVVDPAWIGLAPAPMPPAPPARKTGETPMSTSFGPTNGDSFAAGYYQGKPGPYAARDVYVAIAADAALPGASFPVVARVYFVPHDYPNAAPDVRPVTIAAPSQQVTVGPSAALGEVSVRIEHVSGGPYVARVYEEFPAS